MTKRGFLYYLIRREAKIELEVRKAEAKGSEEVGEESTTGYSKASGRS